MDGIGGKGAWAWIFSECIHFELYVNRLLTCLSSGRISHDYRWCRLFLRYSGFPGHSEVPDRG